MDWKLGLLLPLGTTSNYSTIANLHTLQFTTAPAKPFLACYVITSHSLLVDSNGGESSVSCCQVLPLLNVIQNCLPAITSTELDCHLFSASLAELSCTQHFSSSLNCQPSTPFIAILHRNVKISKVYKIKKCCKRCNVLAAWKLENLPDAITALLQQIWIT
jgi:hypothetical protein